jgi:squalene-hopene/tetraprenyl-beta-curcumene cyclase
MRIQKLLILGLILMLAVLPACGKKEEKKTPAVPKGTAPDVSADEFNAKIDIAMKKGADLIVSNIDDKGLISVRVEGQNVPQAGITALCVVALTKVRDKDEKIEQAIQKGIALLASLKKKDGGIYIDPKFAPPTYTTAVAIMALNKIDPKKYFDVIEGGQKYLVGIQGKDPKDKNNFGGIGYGSDGTANLSTTQFAIEALKETDCQDKEAFQRAIAFLNRCQNNSETNDLPTSGNDGGSFYSPHSSKAGEIVLEGGGRGYKSYGSMTYAGIKSYIYAGLSKDDSRVKNALKWVKDNYTVDSNPGMENPGQGLFYYYHTMAKTLAVLKVDMFEDSAGVKHDWKKDIAHKLLSMQAEDGSWINEADRWFEGIKPLVTAYALITLDYCRK